MMSSSVVINVIGLQSICDGYRAEKRHAVTHAQHMLPPSGQ